MCPALWTLSLVLNRYYLHISSPGLLLGLWIWVWVHHYFPMALFIFLHGGEGETEWKSGVKTPTILPHCLWSSWIRILEPGEVHPARRDTTRPPGRCWHTSPFQYPSGKNSKATSPRDAERAVFLRNLLCRISHTQNFPCCICWWSWAYTSALTFLWTGC